MINKFEAIKKSVFGTLSPELQEKIAEKLVEYKATPGQMFVVQGTENNAMSIVCEGDLDVVVTGSCGNTILIDTLHAGEFIGLGSLFYISTHSASVVAKTNAVLVSINHDDFQIVLKANPEIGNTLLAHMQKVIRKERSPKPTRSRRGSIDPTTGSLKIAMFDSKDYDKDTFDKINKEHNFEIKYYDSRLSPETVDLAMGYDVVCVFVNDELREEVIKGLARIGVKLIALRCAGFNNVCLELADAFGISIVRVPAYSPYAVAEHAMALLLTLNRKIHKAYNRVRDGDFSLNGLVGFDLHGRTFGVIGTGKIGQCMIDIALGFGCRVVAFDVYPNAAYAAKGVEYMPLDDLFACSDVISLHSPLLPATFHLINPVSIAKMKDGVVIVNTSRGGLIDTDALLDALKSGKIAGAGLDVYEGEAGYFFEDYRHRVIQDDRLARMQAMSNVVITSHQAYLTSDALDAIARVTLGNIKEFEEGKRMEKLTNYVPAPQKK